VACDVHLLAEAAMVGLITSRDLVTHSALIVREFGARCYVRCVWRALIARRAVTFLECI
jgi:hypothetical protein